jgi:hypothetical protein
MKVTDNVRREPFTHQRDMKPGDVFSWNGQPWMMTKYEPDGGRYRAHLRTGQLISATNTEGEIVVLLPEAELLLHGTESK